MSECYNRYRTHASDRSHMTLHCFLSMRVLLKSYHFCKFLILMELSPRFN